MAASIRSRCSLNFLQNSGCSGALVTSKRNAHKVNVKHPRPGLLQRQILNTVTKPLVPTVELDPGVTCTRRSDIPNPLESTNEYERFLISRMREKIEEGSHGLMIFCQQSSCTAKVHRKILVNLQKQDFQLSRINRKVFMHAVRDTRYDTLQAVMAFSTVIITHVQPLVCELMAKLKKIPELQLLCGVVDGRLMSRSQVEQYALLPDKQTLLSHTSALLGQPAQRISGLLTSQQEQLVSSLKSYSSTDTN